MIDECCSDWSFENVDFGNGFISYNEKKKPFRKLLKEHGLKEMFIAGKYRRDSFMWTTDKGDLVMVTDVNPLSGQIAEPIIGADVGAVGYTRYLGISGNTEKVSSLVESVRELADVGKLVEHRCVRKDVEKTLHPVQLLR